MSFKYQSGEEIKKGDRILYFESEGMIELVAEDASDPEQAWHVEEFGGGIMIKEPVSGRTFIPAESIANGDSSFKL